MTDDQTGRALARLTANERECLRRRLLPQTAKEMAIDLGISPHAVEKRLKMARAKLGVTSSLHAARLLAAAEGYQAPVPRPADLAPVDRDGKDDPAAPDGPRRWRAPSAVLPVGAVLMILVAVALLAMFPQAHPAAPVDGGKDDVVLILPPQSPGPHVEGEPAPENAADIRMRNAGPDEVAAFARSSFATMDKDGSGFIEQAEAPIAGVGTLYRAAGHPEPSSYTASRWEVGPGAQARWIALMDRDGDGQVSEAEYIAYESRIWRDHVPANWAWRR